MYASPAMMPKDLNLPFPPESDPHHQLPPPALMSYSSAPTTLFLGDVCEDLRSSRPLFQTGGGKTTPASTIQLAPSAVGGPDEADHVGSIPLEQQQQLARQSSSPAFLFNGTHPFQSANIASFCQIGTTGRRPRSRTSFNPSKFGFFPFPAGGYYRGRLKGQTSFPSRLGSGGSMTHVSEDVQQTGFPVASWEDSLLLSGSFAASRRPTDPSEAKENGATGSHQHRQLTHHLSLPAPPRPRIATAEKLLQFQDTIIPCAARARRGCATHPRSIAERVRRTKISERMRKLQELVPNMDKQTSTADMLELAVDYIKDLQRSIQTLRDSRAKCTCTSKHKD